MKLQMSSFVFLCMFLQTFNFDFIHARLSANEAEIKFRVHPQSLNSIPRKSNHVGRFLGQQGNSAHGSVVACTQIALECSSCHSKAILGWNACHAGINIAYEQENNFVQTLFW